MITPTWICILLIFFLFAGPVGRSSATTPGAFYFIGSGARARALGNAFVAVADDASAVYWNPAGLTQVESPTVTLMDRITTLDTNYANIAGVLPFDAIGAFGLNVIFYSVGDIPIFDENANPGGDLSNKEGALSLSYAYSISNISFGVSLKGLYQWMDSGENAASVIETRTRGSGIDLALLYQPFGRFRVGIIYHDEIDLEDTEDEAVYTATIPRSITSGIFFQVPIGQHRWHLMADIEQREDLPLKLHFGSELVLFQTVSLRAGLNNLVVETRDADVDFGDLFTSTFNPTFGAGIARKLGDTTLVLDYAASLETIGFRNFVSLSAEF
ncbi:MAG: PorV/PorQ family protein [Candidatus Poribacteria bacterium]|nr:PorV/PorQ family protein [Candidatus Poribacteria bacterium]